MRLTLSLSSFVGSIVAVLWLVFASDWPRWTIAVAAWVAVVSIIAAVVCFIEKWGGKTPDMPGYDEV